MAARQLTEADFLKLLETRVPIATILRSPAQDAIAAIAKLQSDLSAASGVINSVPLGPFNLGGSCDYDCFLGICIHTFGWTWPLDFGGIRGPLQNAIAAVIGASNQWTTAFAPARDWLKGTLPQFSTDFTNQASIILTTNAAIQAAGGVATPAQIAAVKASFADIAAGLGAGRSQMSVAASAIVDFTESLGNTEGELSPFLANMQASMDDQVANMQNNFINSMPCGAGDADGQINNAVATFNSSVATVQASFTQLNNDTTAAATAMEQFVGTIENIIDQYGLVAGQISSAQTFPSGPIQNLHLDIAANEWTQLASYAQQNIQ